MPFSRMTNSQHQTTGPSSGPPSGPTPDVTKADFASSALFDWYDRHGRNLPWRRRWPELAPAYHVWLSEIMLQQTVVATVIPYFLDFTRRWPTIDALAAAPLDDVLAAWAGLGYYARARNLHKAAHYVVTEHAGIFPSDYNELLKLPGVGPYTAGAIAVIGFGERGVVVDGNIERVMSRQFAITTPLPAAKKEIGAIYNAVMPDDRPSDYPQALMDFANAVCTVKNPGCVICPLAADCAGAAQGIAETLPVKAPKKPKESRRGIAFVAHDNAGNAVLIRRGGTGMLGGMLAFPSFGWASREETYDPATDKLTAAPFAADWQLLDESVAHVFTHFALEMDVAVAIISDLSHIDQAGLSPESSGSSDSPDSAHSGIQWQKIKTADLPSLMRKVWKKARTAAGHLSPD